jgi:hypothetical protein
MPDIEAVLDGLHAPFSPDIVDVFNQGLELAAAVSGTDSDADPLPVKSFEKDFGSKGLHLS